MKIKQFQPNEIVFVDEEVGVILEGTVHLKSHSEKIIPPKLIAKFQEGDIIGFDKGDRGLSTKIESWIVTKSPTEIAFIDKNMFDVRTNSR